jgi:DNA processing protein
VTELATAVYAARVGRHLLEPPRSRDFSEFVRSFDERGYLDELREAGVRWIARGDSAFPGLLASIHDPPPGIFVRGRTPLTLEGRAVVAIVGARTCTEYGRCVAFDLARSIAAAGAVVVSGLARGVDGAAHRGALESGTTLAVLGCGIDYDYPRVHAQLAASITEEGWVVSEYPPGVEPAPWRFPARNRIVAGLAQATVVVEARERSGALITADLALEEGREVLAVPGEITSDLSKGVNALLRLGAAPVTCVDDVLEVLGLEPALGPVDDPPSGGAAAAVYAVVTAAQCTADEIVQRTELDAAVVASALIELELADRLSESDGVYRARLGGTGATGAPG